ncbi:SMC-Scp complex subunit ScpB [Planctomycetota bacterium]
MPDLRPRMGEGRAECLGELMRELDGVEGQVPPEAHTGEAAQDPMGGSPSSPSPQRSPSEGAEEEPEGTVSELPGAGGQPDIPKGGTLLAALEAILLVANEPLELRDFTRVLGGCSWVPVRSALRELQRRYGDPERGLELVEVAQGWRLTTKSVLAPVVEKVAVIEREERLTRAQLEVLAIVAYRQPVLRTDIDTVRGADSSAALRQVVQKGFVRVSGRAAQLGRPYLYGTTRRFLERFGLKNLKQLPKPELP